MGNIFSNILEHPKTSIAGILTGLATIAGVLSRSGITLGHAGNGTIVALVGGLASALLGLLAKDPGAAGSPATPPDGSKSGGVTNVEV